jgi:hypothetical protein
MAKFYLNKHMQYLCFEVMFRMFQFNVSCIFHVKMNARLCSCSWFAILNTCLTPRCYKEGKGQRCAREGKNHRVKKGRGRSDSRLQPPALNAATKMSHHIPDISVTAHISCNSTLSPRIIHPAYRACHYPITVRGSGTSPLRGPIIGLGR